MEKHIEIIDGKEVVVKVYATRKPPKKVTAKLKSKTPSKIIIRRKQSRRR